MIQPPLSRFAAALSLVVAASFSTVALTACKTDKQEGSISLERSVWFGNLTDGQTVTSPFTVDMKAANLVVEPAATGITDGHGHFHILIDVPLPEAPDPIPFDEQHRHFGGGDTITTLDLPPGEHTLTLQFAKGDHVPYDPQIAQTIRITVAEPDTAAEDVVDPAAVPGAPAAVTPAAPGS